MAVSPLAYRKRLYYNSQLTIKKNNQATVLANIDKDLISWMDKQVKAGKYRNREQLIEAAIAKLKE
jgi:hypothetical protein